MDVRQRLLTSAAALTTTRATAASTAASLEQRVSLEAQLHHEPQLLAAKAPRVKRVALRLKPKRKRNRGRLNIDRI
jgi:hypothetical protein